MNRIRNHFGGMLTGDRSTRDILIAVAIALLLGALIAWAIFRPQPDSNETATGPTSPDAAVEAAPEQPGAYVPAPVTADPKEFATALFTAACTFDTTTPREELEANLRTYVWPDGTDRAQAGPLMEFGSENRMETRAEQAMRLLPKCGVPEGERWREMRESEFYQVADVVSVVADDEHIQWAADHPALNPENIPGEFDRHIVTVTVETQLRSALADDPVTAATLEGPDPDEAGKTTYTFSIGFYCAGPVNTDPAEPMCAVAGSNHSSTFH